MMGPMLNILALPYEKGTVFEGCLCASVTLMIEVVPNMEVDFGHFWIK